MHAGPSFVKAITEAAGISSTTELRIELVKDITVRVSQPAWCNGAHGCCSKYCGMDVALQADDWLRAEPLPIARNTTLLGRSSQGGYQILDFAW